MVGSCAKSLGLSFCLVFVLTAAGCSWTAESAVRKAAAVASWGPGSTIDVKQIRRSSLSKTIGPWFASAPQPSPRTELLLRKYNVLEQYQNDPDSVIKWLAELAGQNPLMTEVHALAELAELQANASLQRNNRQRAVRLYSVALAHSYQFLFDPKLQVERNAYDPQFRSICDIYNRSLESMLREVCQDGIMIPGQAMEIRDDELNFEFEVQISGRWKDEQFERFELVGDYQTRGFDNEYRTYGLGVPLIAVRKHGVADQTVEKYYPPDLTFPMTAFCQFSVSDIQGTLGDPTSTTRRRAVLTLYDPLETKTIKAGEQIVPLQSDITTPLAYHLDDPLLNTGVLATASLLNAETTAQIHGMYMLEPYDPNKIPVVMVHGLWSSPVTWAQMFNDLRANAEIHKHYQFWFYSYSTAQPFWVSARQMRRDLSRIRSELSSGSNSNGSNSNSLDQMVLVGHSMGGLVSKMQTVNSGDAFWNLVSDEQFDSLAGDPETIEELKATFFFEPNASVKRVVSIATPYQGSQFANAATRWFSQKLFTLPSVLTRDLGKLIDLNFEQIKNPELLSGMTSIDSLANESPVIQQLEQATVSSDVTFNNVIGRLPKKSLLGNETPGDSDGVVLVESAHCKHASSEIFVPEEHSHVHQHAACIYEVQRILLANLVDLDRIRVREIPQLPVAQRLPMMEASGPIDSGPKYDNRVPHTAQQIIPDSTGSVGTSTRR